jgi:hypothetical protein
LDEEPSRARFRLGCFSQADSRRKRDDVSTEKMLIERTQAKTTRGAVFYPHK